jgi:hypothetical protein
MPIASYKPIEQLPTEPNLPNIEPKDYKSIVYSDTNVPLHSLIAYSEGAPWNVTYYKQFISKHNDLREIDVAQPSVYQQYEKINNLEIRVADDLSTSHDSSTGLTRSTGSALVYPFIVPNIGDYFITDAGISQPSIFKITNVERKTFNRDSAFLIEYELVGYKRVLVDIFNDLEDKSIREYFFNKDRLLEGSSPILIKEDQNNINNLSELYRDIINYYFNTFFSRKYMTLVIPGQSSPIYDHFLVTYLLKIVETTESPNIRELKQLPIDNDPYLKEPQFFSLLLNKDYNRLFELNQSMGLVNKLSFNDSAFLHGLNYSNIQYIVYPIEPDTTVRVGSDEFVRPITLESIVELPSVKNTILDLTTHIYTDTDNTVYPYIKEILVDSYYVLSTDFYNDTTNKSLLEILVKDYLKNSSIDLVKLVAICNQYYKWGRLEQFYYGPILLTLIKESKRSTYSN